MQLLQALWKPKTMYFLGKKIYDWDFLVPCPVCHSRYYRSSPIWRKYVHSTTLDPNDKGDCIYICQSCYMKNKNPIFHPIIGSLKWLLLSVDGVRPNRTYYGYNTTRSFS